MDNKIENNSLFIPEKYIPEKFIPEKFISEKYVPEKYVPEKYVPEKFVPEKYVPEKYISEKYIPVNFTNNQKIKAIVDKFLLLHPDLLDKSIPEIINLMELFLIEEKL
nr:hypothetical protein [Mimivirus sp.]